VKQEVVATTAGSHAAVKLVVEVLDTDQTEIATYNLVVLTLGAAFVPAVTPFVPVYADWQFPDAVVAAQYIVWS
jgi:hypothetical protein